MATAPALSTSREVFVDQAAASGLDFIHGNGMTGRFYFPEMTGAGAAFVDVDNDGDLDVFLRQGSMLGGEPASAALLPAIAGMPAGDRLFRNDLVQGPGGARIDFVDVTDASDFKARGYAMGVIAGDVDNDGWTDLYLTNFGPNQLLRNRRDGTFEDVTMASGADDPRWSVAAVFFDADRDGWLDLFIGNYVDFTIATHKPCRADTGAPDYCGPLAYDPAADRLLRNRGDGSFEDVTVAAGLAGPGGAALGALAADFDDDGWLDLYVANDGTENHLWMNQRDGTFLERGLLAGCAVNGAGQPEASMGVDAADVDRDGDEDLFMAHLTKETNTLFVNDGQGLFADGTVASGLGRPSFPFTGFGTSFFDYDNDGWLDVIVANGEVRVIEAQRRRGEIHALRQRNQLYRGLGGGRFEEVARPGGVFDLEEVSRGVAVGDVDNDGDADVLITNNGGPARLLVNQVGQDRPWLGLRLVDEHGRDALGARVRLVRVGAPTLVRRVRTAHSYASSSDARVLFGLADGQELDHVEVRWPDGREESFPAPAPGAYYEIHRGRGKAGLP